MAKKIFPLFFVTLFVSACSLYSVNYEETASSFYAPKKSVNDVAYLEDVTEPHEVVGVVTVNTERRQKMEEVIEKMKREAAALGGDAITNVIINNTNGTKKKLFGAKLFANANIRTTFTATVIAFKDEPPNTSSKNIDSSKNQNVKSP